MGILLSVIIIIIAHIMINIILKAINKRRQHTFIYCPRCNNELVKNGEFIEDNDGIIKYKCDKCGTISFWDFVNFPVPYLRTCGDCKYLFDDGLGKLYCKNKECNKCSPDTQKLFEHR